MMLIKTLGLNLAFIVLPLIIYILCSLFLVFMEVGLTCRLNHMSVILNLRVSNVGFPNPSGGILPLRTRLFKPIHPAYPYLLYAIRVKGQET